MTLRRSVGRLGLEFLVVAAGVFFALLAENWRQTRTDRRDEVRAIAALSAEFTTSRAALDRRLDLYTRRRDAQAVILEIARGNPMPEPDSLDVLFRWAIRPGSFDPPTGVLTSLITSGDLELIQDPELRTSLAQWLSAVEDYNTAERSYSNLLWDHLHPRLRATVGLPGGMGEMEFPAAPGQSRLKEAVADPEIQQLLRELVGFASYLLTRSDISQLLDEILRGLAAGNEGGDGAAP